MAPSKLECRAVLTIACDNQEFVIIRKLVSHHIGESSYNLLLRGKLGALLELEVTDGPREREVAVYSTKVNEPAGGRDPSFLAYWEEGKARESAGSGRPRS